MWRARAHVGAVDSHARREWGESRARIAPDLHAVSCLTAPPRPGPVESLRPSVSLSHCQALSPYESLRSARAIGERDVPNASSRVISDLHGCVHGARCDPCAPFRPHSRPPAVSGSESDDSLRSQYVSQNAHILREGTRDHQPARAIPTLPPRDTNESRFTRARARARSVPGDPVRAP